MVRDGSDQIAGGNNHHAGGVIHRAFGLGSSGSTGANAVVALLIAVVATGLEQLSPAGIDNLSVPITVGCLWTAVVS